MFARKIIPLLFLLLSAGFVAAQTPPETNQSTLPEHASQSFNNVLHGFKRLWNWQLFTTEDKNYNEKGELISTHRQGVTLGKILLGIVGLLIGFLIAKLISRTVMKNVDRRFSIDATRSEILEKIFYFLLLAIVFLTTLNWLSIPITAFAFLGGAIAIGAGFGAQAIMNNFISGVILLAEQRIKVGDTIEVDNHLGRVVTLGMRCSRINKGDGVDVLVPNSYLLEKNVINWTLSDPHHRFDFSVGVAYGSPTDQTLELLRQAMEKAPGVVESPAPEVFFESFGDNALIFRLYYWVDVRTADNRKTGSAIRLEVDRICREAGIEIAFPQRDIHLSTAKPLAIRLEHKNEER